MALKSSLFSADPRHLACQTRDSAHYLLGQSGTHIGDVQAALNVLDNLHIAPAEWDAHRYGKSTAAAVLAFKQKRKIVNRSYQTAEDDIVGKMTITALDEEMARVEANAKLNPTGECIRGNRQAGPIAFPIRSPVENGLTLRLLTDDERDVIA